jgi:hypothetical protein
MTSVPARACIPEPGGFGEADAGPDDTGSPRATTAPAIWASGVRTAVVRRTGGASGSGGEVDSMATVRSNGCGRGAFPDFLGSAVISMKPRRPMKQAR